MLEEIPLEVIAWVVHGTVQNIIKGTKPCDSDEQIDRQTDRQVGRQYRRTDRQAGWQADRWTGRQTGRQTDSRRADKQLGQTGMQTDRH